MFLSEEKYIFGSLIDSLELVGIDVYDNTFLKGNC